MRQVSDLSERIDACKAKHALTDADLRRARSEMRIENWAKTLNGALADFSARMGASMEQLSTHLEAISKVGIPLSNPRRDHLE